MGQQPAEKPDTVVFDLGNVLIGWDPYLPFSTTMSRSEWEHRAQAADFFRLNGLADRGVPLAEVVATAYANSAESGDLVSTYYRDFAQSLTGPIPGTADLIEELRGAGHRLLGLTNWSAETISHAPDAAPAIKRLESVVVSGEESITKPDPAIFRRLLDRYGLRPQSTVFIDDSPPNVEAARSLGLVGLQFTSSEQLRQDLAELV